MNVKRILAMAIVVAMICSLSVLAAPMTRPTLVLDYEDFESYADLAAYQANAANMDAFASTALTGGVAAFRTAKGLTLGNKNYNRFYRLLNNNWEIVDDGTGNKVAKMKGFNADSIDGQFVFALDDSWTYAESVADVKDLVFSVDVTPIEVQYRGDNGQVPVRTRVADAGMFYTGTTDAGAVKVLSATTEAFTLMHAQTLDPTVAKFSAALSHSAAQDRGYDEPGLTGAAFNYPKGTKLSMARVVGPYAGVDAEEVPYEFLADKSIFNYNHASDIYMTRKYSMVSVDSFVYGNMRGQQEQLDNFKVYELSRNPDHFYVETQAIDDVAVGTDKIEIIFSQPVSYYGSASTKETIYNDPLVAGTTISNGTTTYTGGTDFTGVVSDKVVTVGSNKEVVGVLTLDVSGITFEEGQTWTITLPTNIRNIARTAMPAEANREITLRTVGALRPSIEITSFEMVKNWGSDSPATVGVFVADGTLQGANMSIRNSTGAPIDVAAIYAIYASNGSLADVVYVNKSVKADSTSSIGAGFKVSQAGTVKAFVWDPASYSPFAAVTERTVTAAAQ